MQQMQQQQQQGRQLITLSGPNVLTLSNTGINNNVNGYHHNQFQQQPQPQNPAAGGAVPIASQPQNGISSDSTLILRPGMKRKASDETLSTSSVNGNPAADEEYKKSTKHFLYHCDVCNFTCQGPGIYFHIVSPKHKNLCQKLGRVYVEPKGVLVGSRGPAKDRGTGQDYQSVDGTVADPFEQDEVSLFVIGLFCMRILEYLDVGLILVLQMRPVGNRLKVGGGKLPPAIVTIRRYLIIWISKYQFDSFSLVSALLSLI